MQRYDAVVVGAGPTGLACGLELKQHQRVVVVLAAWAARATEEELT